MTHVVLRAPMQFVAQGGEPVHAPLVVATIGAFRTRLVLDTGSDVHLITAEAAAAAGRALAAVDEGTDHSGATMDSWVVGDLALTFDEARADASVVLRGVVAIPAPEAFASHGIGGILSPQRLHETAYAVIDEIDDEVALVDAAPDAIRDWLLERHPAPGVLTLERHPTDDRPIVEAAIEPYRAVAALLNTGGRHTEFEPGTVPGLDAAGAAERIGTGVSGNAVMAAAAGRRVLSIAGARIEVPSLMLRAGMADPPAMIGQDVLRGSVVALGPDSGTPIFWQVEAV
jgi:hypothetical protein